MASLITSKVRTQRLAQILRQFPRETTAEVDTWLNKNVRALISSSGKVPGLVQVTPPFGQAQGNAAKERGRLRVQGDIRRVFASASYAYKMIAARNSEMADAFWYFLKKKDFITAQKILADFSSNTRIKNAAVVANPDGALHQRVRARNTGRVSRNQQVLQVIANEGAWNRYIKTKQKNVGLLASSIPNAAGNRFGLLKGVFVWVSKHRGKWGKVTDRKSRMKRQITIGLTSRADADIQRKFTRVLGYRLSAMERELPNVARALEKKLRGRLASA